MSLPEFAFDGVQRVGIRQQAADPLSRLLIKGDDANDLLDALLALSVMPADVSNKTFSNCEECQMKV